MLIDSDYLYVMASREHYEPIERYDVGESKYIAAVKRLLPADWQLIRSSIWMNALPKGQVPPAQGWKIHISATPGNALPILTTVTRLLVRERVSFKFVANNELQLMQNGKRWGRGGAGKFMTIYPRDEAQCGVLLETLYRELIGYRGPYILSDRRYKDSGVVFYRYGGMLNYHRLDVSGRKVPVIVADGNYVDDERSAFFHLPPSIHDPFSSEPAEDLTAEAAAPGLKNGRYTIDKAIVFSNSGGVYIGTDNESGAKVLIKEARPLTNVSMRGVDAVWLLKKEHRLLQLVEDLKIAPKPLDFFQEWEHFYLVEEFLDDSIILRVYMARHSLALRTVPTREAAQEFYSRYCRTLARVAEIVSLLHERNIVFADLSHYNVMVVGDGESADFRLIDFEGAYEKDVDVPASLYTPGFAPREVLDEGISHAADDLYALGSLMLAGLCPMNALMNLDLTSAARFLDAFHRDLSLPAPIAEMITRLLSPKRTDRPQAEEVVRVLRAEHDIPQPVIGTWQADQTDLETFLDRLVQHIAGSADITRRDRLFPADPIVFETNPMSIAYGAAGVAHALLRITGDVPEPVRDWMLKQELTGEAYPSGLYAGLSGIAWVLLELGYEERAYKALELARAHPLLKKETDVFYGAAGWGMTELHFYLVTGDARHLAYAEEAGRHLVATREERDGMYYWTSQGFISCTFAHGASGIANFLVYLYLATGNEEYLDVAGRGLEFVASRAIQIPDDGISWRARDDQPTYTPYWRWGSSGIGMALLRYMQVVPDAPYRELFDRLTIDCDRKYSIFPGRFFGLSGIGEFCLDWERFGSDREHARNAARKNLSGTLLYQVDRGDKGMAFPGDTLSRVSCDFGTGSAGIALFIHRYLHGGDTDFMLDELFAARASREATANVSLAIG